MSTAPVLEVVVRQQTAESRADNGAAPAQARLAHDFRLLL